MKSLLFKRVPRLSFILIFATAILISSLAIRASSEEPDITYKMSSVIETLQERPCDGNFSLAVFGDSHLSQDVFEFMLNLSSKMNPSFIISVGDFTENGQEEEYKKFISQISKVDIPFFVVPGNHEYRTGSGGTSLKGIKRYERIFGRGDYYFDYCGWRFVGLDVCPMDLVTNAQLKWLKEVLEGKEGRAFVFAHYPPGIVEGWEYYFKTNVDKLMEIIKRYKVRYYFSGHFHIYDKRIIGPTTYIIAGSSGGGILKEGEKPEYKYCDPYGGSFYCFIYVMISGDKAIDILVKPAIPPNPEKRGIKFWN